MNIFAGGALQNLSVAAMGVYLYITAQIIVQLLQPLIPALEQLGKEGEQGRMRMNRITFWATVPLAYLQAYGQTLTLTRGITDGASLFRTPFDIFNNFLPTLRSSRRWWRARCCCGSASRFRSVESATASR